MSDYDPGVRWAAALDFAKKHGASEAQAYEFADDTGGDGGERSLMRAWIEWCEGGPKA